MALTPEQIAFCDAYMISFNQTEAAITARPGVQATRASHARWACIQMRKPEVKEEIDRKLVEWRARNRMTVEAFGDQLLDALRVDISDFYDDDGDLLPLSEIPLHARRQIASIETVEQIINDEPVLVKKVKLWDKRAAEKMWGQWQKMFTEKLDVTSGDKPLKVSFTIDLGDRE